MKNQEIISKAISKASENGYKFPYRFLSISNLTDSSDRPLYLIYKIIFSHDFAKAFWGERESMTFRGCAPMGTILEWEYHLQQMVLEKEPIKYLEKFL